MSEKFVDMLRGEVNALGRTEEVVAEVLKHPQRINELFDLYFQDDEWVRLRVSSSLKRIWRAETDLVKPFIKRWVEKVSEIDQPSTQWTFAQLVEECPDLFSKTQLEKSIEQVKGYLDNSDDWIVLNTSIQSLTTHAKDNAELATWLKPRLKKLTNYSKKSVAGKARKSLEVLAK